MIRRHPTIHSTIGCEPPSPPNATTWTVAIWQMAEQHLGADVRSNGSRSR